MTWWDGTGGWDIGVRGKGKGCYYCISRVLRTGVMGERIHAVLLLSVDGEDRSIVAT